MCDYGFSARVRAPTIVSHSSIINARGIFLYHEMLAHNKPCVMLILTSYTGHARNQMPQTHRLRHSQYPPRRKSCVPHAVFEFNQSFSGVTMHVSCRSLKVTRNILRFTLIIILDSCGQLSRGLRYVNLQIPLSSMGPWRRLFWISHLRYRAYIGLSPRPQIFTRTGCYIGDTLVRSHNHVAGQGSGRGGRLAGREVAGAL